MAITMRSADVAAGGGAAKVSLSRVRTACVGGRHYHSDHPLADAGGSDRARVNDQGVGTEVSSPKARGVNQQVKARLSAVRDFLAGRSGEARLAEADDEKAREIVKAELLAAMAGRRR